MTGIIPARAERWILEPLERAPALAFAREQIN